MEAIDDFANENIARSLAYTVLEHRQQHDFSALAAIGSKLLCQRIQFLRPTAAQQANSQQDSGQWNSVVQWQEDDCPQVIETLWSGDQQDKLYQNPVYYKRLDAETLHAMVEFAYQDKTHYAVVLTLEEGGGDISELKYHNTKAFSELEWQVVKKSWPESLEQAEREFVNKITHHPPSTAAALSSPKAPDDYWGGGWSSSEDEGDDENDGPVQIRSRLSGEKKRAHSDKGNDSEDEYYARWSQNPGTLTPGINEQPPPEIERLETQEEYDNSYNPLYTVPSVPDLMDAHHTALAELTQMLHDSLPSGQKRGASTAPVKIDPIPKIVRSRQNSAHHLPGAFPSSNGAPTEVSATTTAAARTTDNAMSQSYGHEAGRMLLEKSLRALVGVGRMLGFKGSEILSITEKIIKEETFS
ncbi:hypothetical protein BDB00DRAFT_770651 [Zychaea mexicana]|uniref:uncharacterized protein n=1 Tax=Zychaea mexicana TaxID=64656 RepID=UPI0022FE95C4|nr:uncharacterized protein BDB00DRAFT_770651 [Zychaea mexicana]KAI9489432.1 hypothetical protein BDB00DRAFT_770651 [Zychaea mexicana]